VETTLGIGVDIIELDRVKALLERYGERFPLRILAEPERARARALRDPTSFVAGRFAAKESILKVLGTGLSGGISWQDLVVVREASGAPRVLLRGAALARARALGMGRILVSISHGRDHAIAHAQGFSGDPDALRYDGP
jgi:holo-[acyl-carrier protein] synthase